MLNSVQALKDEDISDSSLLSAQLGMGGSKTKMTEREDVTAHTWDRAVKLSICIF